MALLTALFACGASVSSLSADTLVKLGEVRQISGPQDVDLDGEFVYAINFSSDDPARTIHGVRFLPDRLGIPGAVLVGPQQVTPWQTKPEFGATSDANALEDLLADIRWANSGGGERLQASLDVTPGEEYKLQILISANGPEDRRWDIRVNGLEAVDEITSLGVSPGQSYARGRATLYRYQFTAVNSPVVVEMGDLFGANDGADRNPIWQALTLERVTAPPTPDAIVVNPTKFFRNQSLPIARVQVVDRKVSANHTVSLVDGPGAEANGRFILNGADLLAMPGAFPVDPFGSVYSIRLQAVDLTDPKRSIESTATLTLVEPHVPTAIRLDSSYVSAAALEGGLLAHLSAVDPDEFDQHVFSFATGEGDGDNGQFTMHDGALWLARALPLGVTEFRVRLKATDRAGLFIEQAFVLPVVQPKVRINEILASEVGGVADESHQAQEWIEIQNLLDQPLDLTGWYLSDNRGDLKKWRIPQGILAAGGFLVVLADGSGAVVPGSAILHANFSLSAAGEWLGLIRPDGVTLASELRAPAQYPGVSYGYGPDETLGYLPQPTAGATNVAVAVAGENPVIFSKPHGFFAASFDLELNAAVAGSTIRYTLDGTRPTATTGTVYNGPIKIGPSTSGNSKGVRIVRAIAVNPKAAYAPVGTQTYLYVNGASGPAVDGVVSQPRLLASITKHATYGPLLDDAFLALPALSVVMSGGPSSSEARASIELVDPTGAEAGFQVECGIEATGTTSLASPKLSMAAKFRPEYGASRLRYPMFARGSMAPVAGASEFKELRLRGHSHDNFFWLGTRENPPTPYGNPPVTRSGDAQLMRNLWMDEMQIFMGQPGKRGRQVHLYLNGAYHGIYHIHEHPDDDFMASYFPGKGDDYHFTGGATTGSEHGGSDTWSATWGAVKGSLNNYAQAVRWVDVTNLCDYMVLSFYAGNDWDWSAQHNWSAAGPKYADWGGWKFFEQDSDIALQDVNADCTDQDVPDGIFTRLMSYPDFRSLFRDRVYRHCFNGGMLTPARAAALYDARMNEISTAIIAETARWQPLSSVGKLPWDRDEEWTNEWRYFQNTFFPQRTSKLIAQLKKHANWWPADPPSLNVTPGVVPAGTSVSFSPSTGKIYFTTDGSDPRMPGGGISGTARTLTGTPVVLSTNLIVSGSSWRFLDTGGDPGAQWTGLTFDDASWRPGASEIGYGDGGEATVANFVDTDPAQPGVQRNPTTYFRQRFDVAQDAVFTSLRLRLICDDGAVVYMNGKEVWRVNMPAGAVTRNTLASDAVIGVDESTWHELVLGPGEFSLSPGSNVIAVEVHQQSPDSADMSFNFELSGVGNPGSSGSAILVDRPLLVRARVRTGTEWSALVEGYFVPEGTIAGTAANLMLTEIHYHPKEDGDAEFLEFMNTSGASIDLSGVVITNAINFVFPQASIVPAGTRFAVVKSGTSFDAVYRSPGSAYYRPGLLVFGPWSGSLSNGGETIEMWAKDGAPVLSCVYGTAGDWPGRPDGGGSSLELEDPLATPGDASKRAAWLNDPKHWRPSSEFNGSPGAAGLGPDNRVIINEVLAAPSDGETDGIEILNVSGNSVEIGGWFLSDSSDEYRKYRLATGTRLEPGQRLGLRESDFGTTANPACLLPFGLSETGDDVFLVEASVGGALLRFVDRLEFGGTPRGISVGRFPDGTGPVVWLREPSIGQPNSLPLPGYEAWVATAFPGGTPVEDTVLDADPDGDGRSNFAEYAFATSPRKPDSAPIEVIEVIPEGGMTIGYQVRTAAAGLRYRVELSADLRVWSHGDGVVEVLMETAQPDGSTRIVVKIPVVPGETPAGRFVRLVVEPL